MKLKKRIWSDKQQAIFSDIRKGDGHTVIVARAGSGKTSTIVEGFSHIPKNRSTLMVAFNKKIGEELRERAPKEVEVKTLHSFGYRSVAQAFGKVNLDSKKMDKIAADLIGNEQDSYEMRSSLVKVASLAKGSLLTKPAEIDALIDQHQIVPPKNEEERPRFIENVLKMLKTAASMKRVIDFDDMIWFPNIYEMHSRQYARIFIDETQDLNTAQVQIALKAIAARGRICAVGDDRQAIYSFRGADAEAMGNVIKRLNAKTLPLSVTYRCARSIVEVAKTIVPDLEAAPNAIDGKVETCDIKRLIAEAKPGDFVLSRINAPLIGVCMGLLKNGVPANIAGRDIGDKLAGMVKRSKLSNVKDFLVYVEEWKDEEIGRLQALRRETTSVEDTADCLLTLAEGAKTVGDILSQIERLFKDGDDHARVICSSTHKAKGLERDRVWMLKGTYLRTTYGKNKKEKTADQIREEENLAYVAYTRAKKHLLLVEGELKFRKAGT